MLAVAAYRDVDLTAGFVVSDSLADLAWDPQFHSPRTIGALMTLYEASVETLAIEPLGTSGPGPPSATARDPRMR